MTTTKPNVPPVPMKRQCPFQPPEEIIARQAGEPVSRVMFPNGTEGWLVAGYEQARAVLRDPRFTVRVLDYVYYPRPPVDLPLPHPSILVTSDPPEHTAYRRLLTGPFTARRMQELRPRIQRIVDDHLDVMEQSSAPADLMKALAFPVPSQVICELIGVPVSDRAEFERTAVATMRLDAGIEEAMAANQRLEEYLLGLIALKRDNLSDDLLSALIASGVDDELIDDETLVNFSKLLLIAGHETTASMIGLGTTLLLRNPDQLVKLQADDGLADRAVEELLRHLTLAHLGIQRKATEDIELGGQLIRAGEYVIIHTASANFDPALAADPLEFDITRKPTAHLTFGFGVHQCLGQQLARLELQIVFTTLFRRFPRLRLAVPFEEIRFRDEMVIYGVHELPVEW